MYQNNFYKLRDWIAQHEGYRRFLYKDTVDCLTIGYGRNIEKCGITQKEAIYLLESDIRNCQRELSRHDWYNNSSLNVQNALINMCFNMGLPRLLKFTKMIKAIEEKNYNKAAEEALNSKWALQVKKRSVDIATMLRKG